MKRTLFVLVVGVVALLLVGCASTSSGTKMSSVDIGKIEKGKTTRAEVERLFGPPMQTVMTGNDQRMMVYTYHSTTAQAKPETAIPIVGIFIGGARGRSEIQTLYVRLDKNNVVEDYEFNNSARALDSTFGFNTKMESKPVAPSDQSAEAKK